MGTGITYVYALQKKNESFDVSAGGGGGLAVPQTQVRRHSTGATTAEAAAKAASGQAGAGGVGAGGGGLLAGAAVAKGKKGSVDMSAMQAFLPISKLRGENIPYCIPVELFRLSIRETYLLRILDERKEGRS